MSFLRNSIIKFCVSKFKKGRSINLTLGSMIFLVRFKEKKCKILASIWKNKVRLFKFILVYSQFENDTKVFVYQ